MGLFSMRKQILQQAELVKQKKTELDHNVNQVKSQTHHLLTSPMAFVSSFAAGATAGWFMLRPRTAPAQTEKSDAEAKSQAKPASEPHSLISGMTKELVGIGLSLVAAEATRWLSQSLHKQAPPNTGAPEDKGLSPTKHG